MRTMMTAGLGSDGVALEVAEAPLFSIGEEVCTSTVSSETQPVENAAAADAAFAAENLVPEGEWEPPKIADFTGQHDQGGMWVFTGFVLDDGPVNDLTVIYYWQTMPYITTTDANGYFEFAVYVGNDMGWVEANALDNDAFVSDTASYYVMGGF